MNVQFDKRSYDEDDRNHPDQLWKRYDVVSNVEMVKDFLSAEEYESRLESDTLDEVIDK